MQKSSLLTAMFQLCVFMSCYLNKIVVVPQNYTALLFRDTMTIINTDVPLLKLQYVEHNIAWIKDVCKCTV